MCEHMHAATTDSVPTRRRLWLFAFLLWASKPPWYIEPHGPVLCTIQFASLSCSRSSEAKLKKGTDLQSWRLSSFLPKTPGIWNNPNGHSVNWDSRELKTRKEQNNSASSWFWRWSLWLWRGKPKGTRLEFSGWHLQPYILLGLYIHVCIRSTDKCSSKFRCIVAWGSGMHQA